MGMCYIDPDNGTTGLTDEERKEYEFSTHYHPSNSIKSQVIESNCSSYQNNVNNQRRK